MNLLPRQRGGFFGDATACARDNPKSGDFGYGDVNASRRSKRNLGPRERGGCFGDATACTRENPKSGDFGYDDITTSGRSKGNSLSLKRGGCFGDATACARDNPKSGDFGYDDFGCDDKIARLGTRVRPARKPRRGVLLLVVLSLLVLFLLVGLSFVVVASHYRRAGIAQVQHDRTQSPADPRALADQTVMQLLRGNATNTSSALAAQSLLADLYGADGFRSEIQSVSPAVAGQFLRIEPTTNPGASNHYFAGNVITMVSGPAAGLSSRVVAYEQFPAPVLAVESFDGIVPDPGDRFVVNGRPLNGTGGGSNSHSSGINWCLLPGHPDFASNVTAGGMDESYDAPDFQNTFLAWIAGDVNGGEDIIPSFHRPAAIHYIKNYYDSLGQAIPDEVFAGMTARPTWVAHPKFSGSNPYLDPASVAPDVLLNRLISGTDDANGDGIADVATSMWDVDNDGDGLADSVWIDAGFPLQPAPDGRTIKPLVAILCLDLDGRINLNTAGIKNGLLRSDANSLSSVLAGGVWLGNNNNLSPLGMGYGAAEIDMTSLLGSPQITAQILMSRYQASGESIDAQPGLPGYADAWVNHDVIPNIHGSPPDLFARTITLLDHLGQPIIHSPYSAADQFQQFVDQPYEFNLVDENGRDNRFREVDLEPLLRPFDVDTPSLSPRLSSILTNVLPAPIRTITTRSFDIPTPNVLGDVFGADALNVTLASAQKTLFPFEFQHGMKMNLNRLLGDTIDNGGNGVVDEPSEIYAMPIAEIRRWMNDDPKFLAPTLVPAPIRQLYARHLYCLLMRVRNQAVHLNDLGMGEPTSGLGALTTARVLAQWAINVVDFCDADSIMTPFEVDLNIDDGTWDVDGNPGTNEGLHRLVLWGTERPELVITETLAWHDRRTEDRDDESIDQNGMPVPPDQQGDLASGKDSDLDQHARPRGALFVELFNPNASAYLKTPAEFYNAQGLELSRIASDGAQQSAVWRLLITTQDLDPDMQPIAGEQRIVYFVNDAIYNSAAFGPKSVAGNTRDYYFGNTVHGGPLVIAPSQYAVIGSPGVVLPDGALSKKYVSTMGLLEGEDFSTASATNPPIVSYDQTRSVVLRPDASTLQAEVVNNGSTGNHLTPIPRQPAAGEIRPNIAVVVNLPEPLTISEPLRGYPATIGAGAASLTLFKSEDFYTQVLDRPLDIGSDDKDRFQVGSVELPSGVGLAAPDPTNNPSGEDEGVVERYRIVYLQRLANPLQPFDPVSNPYRTVDQADVDLMVFNGLGEGLSPAGDTASYAKQRGDNTGRRYRNLWGQEEPTAPNQYAAVRSTDPVVVDTPAAHHFDFLLRTSLGHLSSAFQPAFANSGSAGAAYVGAPDTTVPFAPTGEKLAFPWMTWLNRPFANAMELLGVPRTSSSQMLGQYEIPVGPGSTSAYGYLLDFFTKEPNDPQLYKLFEYVEVPSRFLGTDRWYTATEYNTAATSGQPRPPAFFAPNNRMSQFRDPGRVNLNTISDGRVWAALASTLGGRSAVSDLVQDWKDQVDPSRRGYIPDTWVAGGELRYDNLNLNAAVPTQFANPFRSAYAAGVNPFSNLALANEREVTLLRRGVDIDTGNFSNAPLLDSPVTPTAYHDQQRNPAFRYQSFQKLSQTTTTHSNVFAVWLTIGYFELQPDGTLGKEVGIDTGSVSRHRAFYIIDRSIPVAFEPGKDYNVRKAIVLERFLE